MSASGDDNGETPPPVTETEKTRIFVGGLGAAVTAEDLRNTFGSVGIVDSVEIIRSKGRSFAYLDFVPSSDKSLSKLFSMYNGCMWKGGRLKLEKAKEHYLLRLEREWSEEAEPANNTIDDGIDATKNMDFLKNHKSMEPKASEIRLFFPKLRKLRPIPFKGTGKHKYSFQRIEVPSLPLHFCDCEEHSKPLFAARENKLFGPETKDGGIDEKELSIMESVMNRLFEKEDRSKAGKLELINKREAAPEPSDDLAVDDDEADDIIDEDDDNLVMNMVAMTKSRGQEMKLDKERALANGLRISRDKPLVSKPVNKKINKGNSPNAELTDGLVAHIDIEDKRSSKKMRPHNSKVSPKGKAVIDTSSLKMSENNLKPTTGGPGLVDETEVSTEPVDDNEVDNMTEEEDDGLVLNMFGEGNNKLRKEPVKGSVPDGIQVSNFKPSNSVTRSETSKNKLSSEKRKSPHTEATDEIVSIDTDNKRSPKKALKNDMALSTMITSTIQKSNIDTSLSTKKDTTDEKHMAKSCFFTKEESDAKNENQNQNLLQETKAASLLEKPNAGIDKQPKKGALWAQKSSWTDLVGGTNASFSISQLLPSTKFENQEQPNNFFAKKPTVDEPNLTVITSSNVVSSSEGGSKASSGVVKEKAKIAPIRYSIGETCTFMRSDASMKEWKSTKAALNESLKKKTNEKK